MKVKKKANTTFLPTLIFLLTFFSTHTNTLILLVEYTIFICLRTLMKGPSLVCVKILTQECVRVEPPDNKKSLYYTECVNLY